MTTPGPYPPPGYYPPPTDPVQPTPKRVRPADVTATIVLILLIGFFGVLSLILGLFLAMASDGCYDNDACYDRVGTGVLLIELAPIVAWLPTTVWAIVRMMRRKIAFWVPLLALPIYLVIAVWGLSFLST